MNIKFIFKGFICAMLFSSLAFAALVEGPKADSYRAKSQERYEDIKVNAMVSLDLIERIEDIDVLFLTMLYSAGQKHTMAKDKLMQLISDTAVNDPQSLIKFSTYLLNNYDDIEIHLLNELWNNEQVAALTKLKSQYKDDMIIPAYIDFLDSGSPEFTFAFWALADKVLAEAYRLEAEKRINKFLNSSDQILIQEALWGMSDVQSAIYVFADQFLAKVESKDFIDQLIVADTLLSSKAHLRLNELNIKEQLIAKELERINRKEELQRKKIEYAQQLKEEARRRKESQVKSEEEAMKKYANKRNKVVLFIIFFVFIILAIKKVKKYNSSVEFVDDMACEHIEEEIDIDDKDARRKAIARKMQINKRKK